MFPTKLEKPCILSFKNLHRKVGGYPRQRINGKLTYLHRWALEQKLGRPIKPGYQALHLCDVSNCIEPTHIVEGTQARNLRHSLELRLSHGWRRGNK